MGIDVIPYKTCTFNCVYCERGRTTRLTTERAEFYPVEEVFKELSDYLASHPFPDCVTFSGSGEPTLYSKLGQLTKMIKAAYPDLKVALLTNSSLFSEPKVRQEAALCDLVLPSLDACTREEFLRVDRPHKDIDLTGIVEGLIKFRSEFSGPIWLEILIVQGVNDSPKSLSRLHETILKIKPDKVQLNTIVRPPAEPGCQPVPGRFLQEVAESWSDLDVEVLSHT
ncbi:MAG: radical SAM protein [Firmicutes bacterium]|nr:radical SAM protein [Bacillota bacterium]